MNQDKLKPALIGGGALGLASSIPILSCLNCACCALVIGGGFLAMYLYMKDAPRAAQPPYGDGAVVGLIAGVVGAVVATLISIPMQMVAKSMGFGGDPEQIRQMFEQMDADVPPQLVGFLESVAGGGSGGIIISFLMNLVLFSIFAIVGALIAASVLHKKQATAV